MAAARRNRQALMADQLKLVRAEKKLENLLKKVNEHMNNLLVEELQIKSNSINVEMKPMMANPMICTSATVEEEEVNPNVINQQDLNLDTFVIKFLSDEEESD